MRAQLGKLFYFRFIPGDWMKDPELRAVSSGARGLWIDMLSLMFESVRRGYLQFNNGKVVSAEHLARMTGSSTDDVSHWLRELETSGVLSRTEEGVIYSRRQVREETERSNGRERVARHRRNKDVTVTVTAIPNYNYVLEVDVGSKESKAKPSSKEEVAAYCVSRGNSIDPQQFFDHYTANGWKRGKTPIADWKACVRTWEGRERDSGGSNGNARESPAEARRRKNRQVLEQCRDESA